MKLGVSGAMSAENSKEVTAVAKPAQPPEEDPGDCVSVDPAGTGGVTGIDVDVEEFVKGDAGTGTTAAAATAAVSTVIVEGISPRIEGGAGICDGCWPSSSLNSLADSRGLFSL